MMEQQHNPNESVGLAWAGWYLKMPADWQPLKLLGTPQKGSVIVGDTDCAIFSLHWERPAGMAVSEGDAWVAKRLKKLGVDGESNPPAKEHFSACGWAHGVETEENKATTHWFGYAASAGLVIGVKVNGFLPAALRDRAVREVLPTLRVTPEGHETTWSMYDVSFKSPPQYELKQRHLFSGDVALAFEKSKKDSLLLRQVYPGDLALKRRSFERWMDVRPFIEHRKLRRRSVRVEDWQHAERRHISGVVRHGRKLLGVPLGWCGPRWLCGIAAHDTSLNRILIAEHLSAQEVDQRMCERAVAQMNQTGF